MKIDPETIELSDGAIKMGFTKETMAQACENMADRIDSIIVDRVLKEFPIENQSD